MRKIKILNLSIKNNPLLKVDYFIHDYLFGS